MHAPARRKRPVLHHFLMSLGLVVLGTVLLWWLLSQRADWRHLFICWLLAVNVTAFGYYGYDKGQARAAAARVPEMVLHGLTAMGGGLGAYAGMQILRHKTIKGRFRILFWLIVALQVALVVWMIKVTWWA